MENESPQFDKPGAKTLLTIFAALPQDTYPAYEQAPFVNR